MTENTATSALAALRGHWAQRGLANDRGATEAELAAFEAQYAVVLPADLRAYFATANGTVFGAYGMEDEHLLGFWHLNEIRPFSEELTDRGSCRSEAARTFAIADHSIWVYGFGIQLSADPAAPTPVVVDIGCPYHQVAPSFTAFIEGYLRGDERVIYPDPTIDSPNSGVDVV